VRRRTRRRFPERRRGRTLFALPLLLACALARAQMEVPGLSHTMTVLDEPVPAPEFVLKDMDGKPHSLKDYRGKYVLINFWATWCPPCRREMPSLEVLYRKWHDKPFMVLAINQWEDPDLVFSYMGQLDVFPTFPILFDRDSAISQAFGVKGLPTSFVVDPEGRVIMRAVGGREFDHPELERTIGELLEK
jgi:thiol-disulfide isomerase/thioredoxin